MGPKGKAKLYGKKPRNRDLVEAFGTLTISDDNRSPLAERSNNALKTVTHSAKPKQTNVHPLKTLNIEPSRIPDVAPLEQTPVCLSLGKTSEEVPTKVPQRKLRSSAWGHEDAAKAVDSEEAAYLSPLTNILDVEQVIQHFDQWAQTMGKLLEIVMIGDGSYANVFKLSSRSNPQEYSIAKLIPLRSRCGPGSRRIDLTTVENAANEVKMLAKMSDVRGFTDFRRAMLLRGQLPFSFRRACKAFDKNTLEARGRVDNETRTRRVNYPKQQIWLFVEMGDAGEELEHFLLQGLESGRRTSESTPQAACLRVQQSRDIFFSTAEALALGEREARFEHRDLHLSNVCLKPLGEDAHNGSFDHDWKLIPQSSGFLVTLIDYTLSRAEIDDGVVYNPMDDEDLFHGEGNLQYDIYRYMKQAVGGQTSSTDWSAFVPETNVIWLHYVLRQLLENTALDEKPQGQANEEVSLLNALQNIADLTKPDKSTTSIYSSAEDILVHMEDQSNIDGDAPA